MRLQQYQGRSGFGGRHLGFPISGSVVQCSKSFSWIAGPRKHGIAAGILCLGGIEPEIRWGYLPPITTYVCKKKTYHIAG